MTEDRVRSFEQGFGQIKDTLVRLLVQTDARLALLIDRDGRLVTAQGDAGATDVTSFASLAAADYAATAELAGLIGEPTFSYVFHQGERLNIYFAGLTEGVILVVIFDARTTLGLVRLKVRDTAATLAQILREFFFQIQVKPEPQVIEDFSQQAENEIDRLFQ